MRDRLPELPALVPYLQLGQQPAIIAGLYVHVPRAILPISLQ